MNIKTHGKSTKEIIMYIALFNCYCGNLSYCNLPQFEGEMKWKRFFLCSITAHIQQPRKIDSYVTQWNRTLQTPN